jgi:hypothetical protein
MCARAASVLGGKTVNLAHGVRRKVGARLRMACRAVALDAVACSRLFLVRTPRAASDAAMPPCVASADAARTLARLRAACSPSVTPQRAPAAEAADDARAAKV